MRVHTSHEKCHYTRLYLVKLKRLVPTVHNNAVFNVREIMLRMKMCYIRQIGLL